MTKQEGFKLEKDDKKKFILGLLAPWFIEAGIPLIILLIIMLFKHLF